MEDWKQYFKELILTDGLSAERIKAAILLKDSNMPSRIYKYRSVGKYALDSLQNGKVWLAQATSFNDPFDSAIRIDPTRLEQHLSRREFLSTLQEKVLTSLSSPQLDAVLNSSDRALTLAQTFLENDSTLSESDRKKQFEEIVEYQTNKRKEIQKQLSENFARNTLICSFSERSESILMWSHYADNHSGFCIEYDLQVLPLTSPEHVFLFPVIYSDNMVDGSGFFRRLESKDELWPAQFSIASATKANDWSYEREWRLVFPPEQSVKRIGRSLPFARISRVLLGSKMKLRNRKIVEKICETRGISAIPMRLRRDSFVVEEET